MDTKEHRNQNGLDSCDEIFRFDWQEDASSAPIPQMRFSEMYPAKILSNGVPYGLSHIDYLLVQRDPIDVIKVEKKTEIIKINAHMSTWKYTFDRYLNQYIRLKFLQEEYLGEKGYVEIALPYEVIKAFQDNKKKAKDRRKELFIDLSELECVGYDSTTGGDCYRFWRVGAVASINLFCRSLFTRSNATAKVLSPQHDGIKFQLESAAGFVPSFTIEDYFFHEFYTGISLSIEIASILLEAIEAVGKEDIWQKAFKDFCQKALPTIVSSSFFFTRNAVARFFFQQILMELIIQSYQWTDSAEPIWENEDYWNKLIDRAICRIGELKYVPCCYEVAENTIDHALSHIMTLLSEMKAPIDIMSYAENPTHGLAAFCNVDHKYVSYFLQELSILGDKAKKRAKNRYRSNEYKKFLMVHKEVKRAIQFVNELQKFRKAKQIQEIVIQDEIPPCVWRTYAMFANSEGGMIILKRPLPHNKVWDPEEVILSGLKSEYKSRVSYAWECNASEIIQKIWAVVNDTQQVSKNILTEEHIQVRELEGHEMIAIRVPRKKTKEEPIYIGCIDT